eukprot:976493_1
MPVQTVQALIWIVLLFLMWLLYLSTGPQGCRNCVPQMQANLSSMMDNDIHLRCKDVIRSLPHSDAFGNAQLLEYCKHRYKELWVGDTVVRISDTSVVKDRSLSKRKHNKNQSVNLLVLDLDETLITTIYQLYMTNYSTDEAQRMMRRLKTENQRTVSCCIVHKYVNVVRTGVMELLATANALKFDILIYSKGKPHHVIPNVIFLEAYFNVFYMRSGSITNFQFDGIISDYSESPKSFQSLLNYGYKLQEYSNLIILDDMMNYWHFDSVYFQLRQRSWININHTNAESFTQPHIVQTRESSAHQLIRDIRIIKESDNYIVDLLSSLFASVQKPHFVHV